MNNHNKKIKGRFGLLVAGLLISSSLHAGIPVWTYSAPSPASVTVSDGGTATVQYTVTNQSHKAKNLILQSTSGLSASACYLAGKGSTCNVTLTINGSEVPKQGIHAGPVLCEKSNPNQCYQPGAANILNVVKSTNPLPVTINLSPSSLTLTTVSPGDTGIVTVTNNPASLANATNITADLSGTGGALSVSYNNCTSVAPGGVCTITFTAHTTLPTISIPIQGSNTNLVSVAVAVDQANISATPASFSVAQGGATQVVTITNSGSVDAYGVGVSSTPGLGVTVSGACASPMAPSDTCQLTFTSGSNTGSTSATISGSNTNSITENITVTTATATTLSVSVSSTPPAVIAVNSTGVTLSIQNMGADTAYNVIYTLPSGWNGVSTSGSCGDIAPGAMNACTLTFTATQPNVTNTIGFSADNVTPAVQSPAIAFSYQGYLVYAVTPTSATEGTAYVINTADSGTNIRWDTSSSCIEPPGSQSCTTTNATSLTDGQYANLLGNTFQIISGSSAIGEQTPVNAAGTCYNISPNGTWYLPAKNELNAMYTTLKTHGFGSLGSGYYWSSTECSSANGCYPGSSCPSDGDCSWEQNFGSGVQSWLPKSLRHAVRCAQAINY